MHHPPSSRAHSTTNSNASSPLQPLLQESVPRTSINAVRPLPNNTHSPSSLDLHSSSLVVKPCCLVTEVGVRCVSYCLLLLHLSLSSGRKFQLIQHQCTLLHDLPRRAVAEAFDATSRGQLTEGSMRYGQGIAGHSVRASFITSGGSSGSYSCSRCVFLPALSTT